MGLKRFSKIWFAIEGLLMIDPKKGKVRHMWNDYNQNWALTYPKNLTTPLLSIILDHFSKETDFLSLKSLKQFLLSLSQKQLSPFSYPSHVCPDNQRSLEALQLDFFFLLCRMILISSAPPWLVTSFFISSDSHANCVRMPQRQLQHSLQLANKSLF